MSESEARQALFDAAAAAQREGDWRSLERIARQIAGVCESAGDARGLALGEYYLGLSSFLQGDGRAAERSYRAALDRAAQAGDHGGMLRAKIGLAAIAGDIDLDVESFRHLSEQALLLARELGDEKSIATTLGNLAEACHLQGDYTLAIRYAGEAAASFLRLERWSSAGAQLATVGYVHALRREYAEAITSMHAAWEYLCREAVPLHRAWYFQVWFLIAASVGNWETAARIYGFVGHYRDVHSTPRLHGMLPHLSGPIERQYRELGADRATELALEGEAYSIERAQQLVAELRA